MFFISVLLTPFWIFVAFTEPFELLILAVFLVIGLMAYVTWSVTLTGYAPSFLLFTHDHKEKK